MIVCVCANKNRRDVEQAIQEGCITFEDLVEQHDICANCQTCYEIVQELLTVNIEASKIS